MKYASTLITLCLIFSTSVAFTRDGVHAADSVKKDSLGSVPKLLRITPYPLMQKSTSLGFSFYALNNERILRNSEGAPVFATQYGQVPNLPAYPLYSTAQSASWRLGASPLIAIDGIPFSANLPTYTSLNVFDYSDITVLSGLNGAAGFGVAGGNGAFVLNSKTGEGYDRPTFDANSYTTYSYVPSGDDFFGNKISRQSLWTQSTSLAYQQDFGKADTRISLNHTGSHLNVPWTDKSTTSALTATMNTGAEILPNFFARVYLQYSSGNRKENELTTDKNFFNTNLRLRYNITPWMNISSTLAYQHNKIGSDAEAASKNRDKNRLGNLFLNVDKKIGKHFTLAPFIGVQSSKQDFSAIHNSGLFSYYQEYSNTAWLAGLNTNLNDTWFASFTYRSDDFTLLPTSTDQSTISGSTAVDLFRLAGISGNTFSLGKIRAAIGSSGVQFPQMYPFYQIQQPAVVNVSGTKTSWETGADLSFFQSRLGISVTYFHDLMEDVRTSSFPEPIYFDIESKGFELVLKATPVSLRDFKWYTSVIWGKTENKLIAPDSDGDGGSLLGNSYPDFKYSFLNQLTWKRWNVNFLLEGSKGGNVYRYNGIDLEILDGTFLKLRDVSLGYDFALQGKTISALRVSAIGRNLSLISSKSDEDPEELITYNTFYKNISLSVSLQF